MTSDLDIWRSANLLVKQHAAGARDHAVERALQLKAKGDAAGHAVWLRIIAAIEECAPKGRRTSGLIWVEDVRAPYLDAYSRTPI